MLNAPACSAQTYDETTGSKHYLELLGATHESPYLGPAPEVDITARVTTDFFDAELAGQASDITAMSVDGNVNGPARLLAGS